jgi:dihydroflavonol-4-reductase
MNLVTGATGHIGNVLVKRLLDSGKNVRALLLPGEDPTPLNGLNLERYEGNVLDFQALESAFKGVQNVYHLAGIISILPGEDALMQLVNVLGTRNVIQASSSAGIRRLVYTSSIHAITRVPHGVKIDESLPFDPDNPYGDYDRSKARASLEVLHAAQDKLDAVVVCPTGVIGPYDYQRSEVGHIIHSCVQKKPQIYVDGAYDFVDVRDVADGLIQACEKGHRGESYILSGEQLSVGGLLDTIQEITAIHFPRIKIPTQMASFASRFTPLYYRLTKTEPRFTPYSLEVLASNSNISHAKARREFDYNPRSLRESISDTVKWFTENHNLLASTNSL